MADTQGMGYSEMADSSSPARTAPPQPETDEPDSPFFHYSTVGDDVLMEGLQAIMIQQRGRLPIPPAPKTAKAAGEMQAKLDRLLQEGRAYEAFPLQCRMAYYHANELGCDHPTTLRAIFSMIDRRKCGEMAPHLYAWLLPRAAKQWGLDSADLRRLVVQAAGYLYDSNDPRDPLVSVLTQAVRNVARALPGGLGWGTATLDPIDEDAYSRHAVMQRRAHSLIAQGPHELAIQMFERCIAYYKSIGPHWLVSARKAESTGLLSGLYMMLQEYEAAEPLLADAKRAAQRELGPEHDMTLTITQLYGHCLLSLNKHEQALSLFSKVLRVRKAVFGPYHSSVFSAQEHMSRVFMQIDKYKEAEEMLKDAFEGSVRSLGPGDPHIKTVLAQYWDLLDLRGRRRDAQQLKNRAVHLGCDVSGCFTL